ncbi:hypothetical protein KIH39_04670 [Telmatocola sphagniphila]|uniref:Tetratricopeptide repeat protein n=1 Tax=Telmatocola sphagniphila TaxID=1123043 RepID=A0A8E6EU35_9BACT|nr:hypothetical protein [Telmatocola sphagniphila]QVL33214.1 hypothetical protein KIH39_04670 [Telmatocola sphagniphila]
MKPLAIASPLLFLFASLASAENPPEFNYKLCEKPNYLSESHGKEMILKAKFRIGQPGIIAVYERKNKKTNREDYPAEIPVKFYSPEAEKNFRESIIASNKRKKDLVAELVAKADFCKEDEVLSKDYVVPDALLPKASITPRFQSLQSGWMRMQEGAAESDAIMEKILADARKKGQTEKRKYYGAFGFVDAKVNAIAPEKEDKPIEIPTETAASSKLFLAKAKLRNDADKAEGIKILKMILDQYPGTKAAKEAAEIFDDSK